MAQEQLRRPSPDAAPPPPPRRTKIPPAANDNRTRRRLIALAILGAVIAIGAIVLWRTLG